ncbi:MAG: hypothetical protein QF357_01150 [Dehalococcoidia bacterium]|nr:hypothetical protein [Dehalococcoidia bacterium]
MGGLQHYIEAAGVATAGISLIREHTEKIMPSRSLWVPFELGRPLGSPNRPDFQLDVLRSLLRLFAVETGPVIEDYPHDAPETAESDSGWSCVLPLPPLEEAASPAEALQLSLVSEVGYLAPWYEESMRRLGRTTFGLSGFTADSMPEIAEFFAGVASGDNPDLPGGLPGSSPGVVRYLADDVKAYYMEAAKEQPGSHPPGGTRMWTWFYHETRMGSVLYDVRDRLAAEHAERMKANGEESPSGPPPMNPIPLRFAARPE